MAAYSWLPKKKVKDNEHDGSIYYKTGPQYNHFHVSPEWVSEENFPRTPMGLRRYRPWPFEFQGARFYPWGSREKRWAEEAAAREAVEQQEVIGEKDPVTDEDRNSEFPHVPLYLVNTNPPWCRPHTSGGASSYSRHMNRSDQQYAPHPPPPPHSARLPYSLEQQRHTTTTTNNNSSDPLFSSSTTFSNSGRAPYDPIAYRGPHLHDEGPLRDRSMMISKCADYQPLSGRPRFERPYMNFANSMWMKYPPDSVY